MVTSSAASCPPTWPGLHSGRKTTKIITWARHMAGAIEISRRWRVMTMAMAKANAITSELASPTQAPPAMPVARIEW